LSAAGREAGLERIACHFTRKTLVYIGITQDIIDNSIEDFNL